MDIREKLVELLTAFYGGDPMYYGVDALAIAQYLISHAAPVQHGRWINANSRPKTYERICTACGGRAYFCGMGCSYKYCPNCGAKMEV